jgi:hypothetical protein
MGESRLIEWFRALTSDGRRHFWGWLDALTHGKRKRHADDNSVAETAVSSVELSRPARKGGSVPYAPRDQDSATLDLAIAHDLTAIDARINESIAAIGRLYELRERALASAAGDGAPRTTEDQPHHRTAAQDPARRRMKKHHG